MSSSLDADPSLVNPRTQNKPLTPMQTHILRCIMARPGYPPSLQEIGHAVGLASKSTVHAHIQALIRKGCLTAAPKTVRTLRLTPLANALMGVELETGAAPPDGKRWVPVLRTSEDVRAFLDSPRRRAPRIAPAEALTPDRTVLVRLERVQGVSP